MNIITKPQSLCFSADMNDYLIDSDASVSLDVYKGKAKILSEEYCPDSEFKIRTRRLGTVVAAALWGVFPDSEATPQTKLSAEFRFDVAGSTDTRSLVFPSRCHTAFAPAMGRALTLSFERTTHIGATEYVTLYLNASQNVYVLATDVDGTTYQNVIYTSPSKGVVTLDVSESRIMRLFPSRRIVSYQVGEVTVNIDQTRYLDIYTFRFLNSFDVPEAVTATGGLTVNGDTKAVNAMIDGIERRVHVDVNDTYTVNSGVIFSQYDYKIWHELIISRRVQIFTENQWLDVIITKSKFERDYKKNNLKMIEFSFRLANPEDIDML